MTIFDPLKAIIGYGLCIVAAVSFQWTYYTVMPVERWFEYDRIEVVEPVYVGGPIKFISYSDTFRPSDISWNDVLFCQFGGEGHFDNYSTQSTSKFRVGIKTKDHASGWWYTSNVPNRPAFCYLRSVSTHIRPLGITKKHHEVFTNVFEVVPSPDYD